MNSTGYLIIYLGIFFIAIGLVIIAWNTTRITTYYSDGTSFERIEMP